MTDYMWAKGYLITYDYYNKPHRHVCKKCGSYITSAIKLQRVWGNKKYHLKMPYCEKCKKFKNWNGQSPEEAIYKPYG